MSSIQSVPGQPLAAPLSSPIAPGRRAAGGDLLRERHQLVPGLRAPGSRACWNALRVVPDQPLEGGLDEDADLLAVDLAELQPVLCVLLAHARLSSTPLRSISLPGARELGHLAGAGQAGHVGRVAALDARGRAPR